MSKRKQTMSAADAEAASANLDRLSEELNEDDIE